MYTQAVHGSEEVNPASLDGVVPLPVRTPTAQLRTTQGPEDECETKVGRKFVVPVKGLVKNGIEREALDLSR